MFMEAEMFTEMDEKLVEFSVIVSLDGHSIEDISQAIYNTLKGTHEVAFIDVMEEYE